VISARSFVIALLAVAVLGVTAAEAKPPKPDLSKVPRLKAIPPAQLAAFPVLQQPVAKKIPNLVLRSFQLSHVVKQFGTDPRQARAITGLRGSPWYVIPGKKGLCLYVSAAFGCGKTADVVERGIWLIRMSVGGPGEPARGPDQVTTYLGLAPAGATGLVMTLASGETTTAPLGPANAYRLDDISPLTRVEVTRDGAAPIVISGP
jgi:hypothetical protein